MSVRRIVVLAGLAAVVAVGAAVTAMARSAPPPDPNRAVVHQSTERPRDVERHWTPERVRQAQENMRHRHGPED